MLIFARNEDGGALTAEDNASLDHKAELWRHGPTSDRVPNGHGEYGLTPSNPIPVIGMLAATRYLRKLRHNGRPVEYQLLGEADSDVTPSREVTVFGLSQAGRDLDPIFVYLYSRRNSKVAPHGFTIA